MMRKYHLSNPNAEEKTKKADSSRFAGIRELLERATQSLRVKCRILICCSREGRKNTKN